MVNRKTWGGNRTWLGRSRHPGTDAIVSGLRTAHQDGLDAIAYLTALTRALLDAYRAALVVPLIVAVLGVAAIAFGARGPAEPTRAPDVSA